MKTMNNKQKIENNLMSELRNFIYEYNSGELSEESIFIFFTSILQNANVDSNTIVNVLEEYGTIESKNIARNIKVEEGW